MNHDDHVRLIAGAFARPGGIWADFGAGTGAFTLALRDVAGPEVEIIAIDRDAGDLRELRRAMERAFPGTLLHTNAADFTRPLDLPPLDGILAADHWRTAAIHSENFFRCIAELPHLQLSDHLTYSFGEVHTLGVQTDPTILHRHHYITMAIPMSINIGIKTYSNLWIIAASFQESPISGTKIYTIENVLFPFILEIVHIRQLLQQYNLAGVVTWWQMPSFTMYWRC